jgi:uncharacterized membrane protein
MKDPSLLEFLVLLCALGAGIVGGAFFAFSTFVMRALGKLPPPQGIAAMQSINVVVINAWFMTALFGTALLCIAVAAMAVPASRPGWGWLAAGGASYVLGTIGVTIAFNVPRNNALAGMPPSAPGAGAAWSDYLAGWTFWNHVRTAAAIAACAAFIVAFRAGA